MSKVKYEFLRRDTESALTVFELQLLGVKIDCPEPVLTSRDINAVKRCSSHLEDTPVFDNSIYQEISLFEKGASRTNPTALDESTWRKDKTEEIKESVKTPDSPLKTWHAQINHDTITPKRSEAIFHIGADAGLAIIELPIPFSLNAKNALKLVNECNLLLSKNQILLPLLDAETPPTVFEAFSNELLELDYHMLGVRRAPIISSDFAAQNYRLIRQNLSKKLFVVAMEITNPRSEAGVPTPVRGVHLVRNYGISSFSYRVRRPMGVKDYTIENAKRFDNAQGLDLISMTEHNRRHGLDLNCQCEACIGKDARQYYNLHSDGQVYSGLSAIHTARSLAPALRGLVGTITKP